MTKRMVKTLLTNSLFLLLPLAVGCGGSRSNSVTQSTDVYAAGISKSGAAQKAVLWRNGTPVELTDGTMPALAFSVAVDGSRVFVAGQQENTAGIEVAMVWTYDASMPFTAGSFTPWALTDGTKDAKVDDILVTGSQVYASGYESNGLVNVAKVWKPSLTSSYLPGTAPAAELSDGAYTAEANLLVASGTMIYVGGYDESGVASTPQNMGPLGTTNGVMDPNVGVAMVWTYDTRTPFGVPAFSGTKLSDGSMDANVNELIVTGTQVLCAGYQFNGTNDDAGLWSFDPTTVVTPQSVNYQRLSDGTSEANANTIIASDTTIYIAGYAGKFATQWSQPIGGSAFTVANLSDGTQAAEAQSLFVVGEDVYIGGMINNGTMDVAQLWTDETPAALQDGTDATEAYSIFVSPRIFPVPVVGSAAVTLRKAR
jgi:hypothetical protein